MRKFGLFLVLIFCIPHAWGQSCSISLGNDTTLCNGGNIPLSIASQITWFEDSLRIVYDATQGQTGLVNSPKVYMHAGAELVPFGGWQYTTGNWGQDDGIGRMRSIGTNLWEIVIHPQSYFGYPQGSSLNGVLMVFRNADGTQTGKDASGSDIFVNTAGSTPTCAFSGVTPEWKTDGIASILWSDGATVPSTVANGSGTWWVRVTDTAGCIATDSVNITLGGAAVVDLGPNLAACNGQPITLDAGPGFTSYLWSNGATTQSITVNTGGNFWVEVTDPNGCTGLDLIYIDAISDPVAGFSYQSTGNLVQFADLSTDARHWEWDFNSDNITDDTTANPSNWFSGPGTYPVKLSVQNDCGTDEITQNVVVGPVSIENARNLPISVYPNPFHNQIRIDGISPAEATHIRITDPEGRELLSKIFQAGLPELNTIQTGFLNPGTYFISIWQADREWRQILIKTQP